MFPFLSLWSAVTQQTDDRGKLHSYINLQWRGHHFSCLMISWGFQHSLLHVYYLLFPELKNTTRAYAKKYRPDLKNQSKFWLTLNLQKRKQDTVLLNWQVHYMYSSKRQLLQIEIDLHMLARSTCVCRDHALSFSFISISQTYQNNEYKCVLQYTNYNML